MQIKLKLIKYKKMTFKIILLLIVSLLGFVNNSRFLEDNQSNSLIESEAELIFKEIEILKKETQLLIDKADYLLQQVRLNSEIEKGNNKEQKIITNEDDVEKKLVQQESSENLIQPQLISGVKVFEEDVSIQNEKKETIEEMANEEESKIQEKDKNQIMIENEIQETQNKQLENNESTNYKETQEQNPANLQNENSVQSNAQVVDNSTMLSREAEQAKNLEEIAKEGDKETEIKNSDAKHEEEGLDVNNIIQYESTKELEEEGNKEHEEIEELQEKLDKEHLAKESLEDKEIKDEQINSVNENQEILEINEEEEAKSDDHISQDVSVNKVEKIQYKEESHFNDNDEKIITIENQDKQDVNYEEEQIEIEKIEGLEENFENHGTKKSDLQLQGDTEELELKENEEIPYSQNEVLLGERKEQQEKETPEIQSEQNKLENQEQTKEEIVKIENFIISTPLLSGQDGLIDDNLKNNSYNVETLTQENSRFNDYKKANIYSDKEDNSLNFESNVDVDSAVNIFFDSRQDDTLPDNITEGPESPNQSKVNNFLSFILGK